MMPTREIRDKLSGLGPSDCGMKHHYVWKHGHELPPCPIKVRDSSLDCAHSTTPALTEALSILSRDPRVSPEFINTARMAISLANDMLWVTDLLAIDIADISQGHPPNETAGHSTFQELRRTLALRSDNSLDLDTCEQLIKDGQQHGRSLKLRVRGVMLSIIDSIENNSPRETVDRIIELGRVSLEREVARSEEFFYASEEKVSWPQRA